MIKEFVLYEQALALKELGFDEPCFGFYYPNGKLIEMHTTGFPDDRKYCVLAPLYQQAFRWFREKHGFDCSFEDEIIYDEDHNEIQMWDFFIYKTKQNTDNKIIDFCSNNFHTYIESFKREDAELECLRNLIEIVKNK